MTFLNPLFFWFIPLLSAPLIIHLIHKKNPQHLVFSHIKWLREIHQDLIPKKRLKEILLLIIRTLLLLFIVLFFSRPLIHTGGIFSSDSDKTTIIFLIDVSASMGAMDKGRSGLDWAKDHLQELILKIPSENRLGMVAFSDQVEKELAPSSERSRLISAIRDLKLISRPTDIRPAIELVSNMLAHQNTGTQKILIVSDGAKSGWRTLLGGETAKDLFGPDVQIILWETVPLVDTVGITEANLQLNEEGVLQGYWVLSDINGKILPKTWSLNINGKTVGQGRVEGQRQQKNSIPIEAKLPEGGFYSGFVETSLDSLPFDDKYFVAGRIPKGFSLLIVDGETGLAPADSESFYLKSALESPRDPRLKLIQNIRLDSLASINLAAFDGVVLANVGHLGESGKKIMDWLQKGGGVFLTAGSRWDKESLGIPLNFFQGTKQLGHKIKVKKPDRESPLSATLAQFNDFEFDQIEVDQYFKLGVDSTVQPVLFLENGDPLLVQKNIGKGRVWCLATTLDRAWTNFPSKPIFSPLMREIIAKLSDPLSGQSSLMGFVDEPLNIQLPLGVRNVTVMDPAGVTKSVHVDSSGWLSWLSPYMPGLYQVITNQDDKNFSFAINFRDVLNEGNLKRVNESELKSIFSPSPVSWVSYSEKSWEGALVAIQGKDMTPLLMGLVFLLFIIETILSWSRKKIVLSLLLVLLPLQGAHSGANKFVYSQIKHSGTWDPYPGLHENILEMIKSMTNIPFDPNRNVRTLEDEKIFETPFFIIKGNSGLTFNAEEKKQLKKFIDRGGLVFLDDTLADSKSAFSISMRKIFSEIFPGKTFEKLDKDHALYRSFFLLKNVAGRRISERYLEGLDVGGEGGGESRTAVIYCPNDLLGAWVKDALGHYAYSCDPGGESQRWESFKLTINLIYFSLTGTYKKDAIHQPFIEQKLGS